MGALEPSKFADLIQIQVKEKSVTEKEAVVRCEIVLKLKEDYEGGVDKTPREL